MEIVDRQVRQDILEARGSIVVSASAGSGKTTIMIDKILKKLSEITDHQTVGAITFTVKATEEIRRKAVIKGGDFSFVVMTNDSFVEYEIIRPFLRDAFGEEYTDDFVVCYDSSAKSGSFNNGMNVLKSKNKLGTYYNNKNNFKFELAIKVLANSTAAREYFKSKYAMLFLDEFQDSDTDMYNFFMYLKNELEIDLFIVGDEKQAIYLWRGAQRNIFRLLEDENIQSFELITNFRSHPEIVNYANIMHNNAQFNVEYQEEVQRIVHCKTYDPIQSFVNLCVSNEIDKSQGITIIANINKDAKEIADSLNELDFNFVFIPKTPLDDGSEYSHVLKAIACFVLDINYSIYDLVEVLRVEQRRTILTTIEKLLSPLTDIVNLEPGESKEDIQTQFFESISNFSDYLGLNISRTEYQLLLDTLTNGFYYSAFIKADDLHKVMTVFGSKGLEFKQVVSFAPYYDFSNEEKKNNHYVCVTRAEDKFIMFEGSSSNYSDEIAMCAERMGMLEVNRLYKMIDHT